MQGIAPIDEQAVEDAVLPRDLFEQGRIAIDVAGRRHVGPIVLAFQGSEISIAPSRVDVLEAGLTVSVESRAAEVLLEQVMNRCQPVRIERIEVRDALQN